VTDRTRLVATGTVLGGGLGLVCCAVSFLVPDLLGGLATLLASGDRVLALVFVATIVLAGVLLRRDLSLRIVRPAVGTSSAAVDASEAKASEDRCSWAGDDNGAPLR